MGSTTDWARRRTVGRDRLVRVGPIASISHVRRPLSPHVMRPCRRSYVLARRAVCSTRAHQRRKHVCAIEGGAPAKNPMAQWRAFGFFWWRANGAPRRPHLPLAPARPKRHEVGHRTDPPDPQCAAASQRESSIACSVEKGPPPSARHEGDPAPRRRDSAPLSQAARSVVHRRDQQISSVRSVVDRS
jgi:hypothetical protein